MTTPDVKAAAAALGRRGGSANTPAQKAARSKVASANGKHGGRPRLPRVTLVQLVGRYAVTKWVDIMLSRVPYLVRQADYRHRVAQREDAQVQWRLDCTKAAAKGLGLGTSLGQSFTPQDAFRVGDVLVPIRLLR